MDMGIKECGHARHQREVKWLEVRSACVRGCDDHLRRRDIVNTRRFHIEAEGHHALTDNTGAHYTTIARRHVADWCCSFPAVLFLADLEAFELRRREAER